MPIKDDDDDEVIEIVPKKKIIQTTKTTKTEEREAFPDTLDELRGAPDDLADTTIDTKVGDKGSVGSMEAVVVDPKTTKPVNGSAPKKKSLAGIEYPKMGMASDPFGGHPRVYIGEYAIVYLRTFSWVSLVLYKNDGGSKWHQILMASPQADVSIDTTVEGLKKIAEVLGHLPEPLSEGAFMSGSVLTNVKVGP